MRIVHGRCGCGCGCACVLRDLVIVNINFINTKKDFKKNITNIMCVYIYIIYHGQRARAKGKGKGATWNFLLLLLDFVLVSSVRFFAGSRSES